MTKVLFWQRKMSTEEAHLINLPTVLSEAEFSEIISISIICRLCANQSDKLISIFSEDGVSNDLAGKINLYLPVKVVETDNLPLQCCWQCASTILAWHDLVVTSVEADRRLRSYQFVTEKQLEEITSSYGGNETILTTTADEDLQKRSPKRSDNRETDSVFVPNTCEEIGTAEVSESEDNVLNLNKTEAKIKQKETYLYHKDCADFDRLTCNICERTLHSKISLKAHLRDIHRIKVPKVRRKKCDVLRLFRCSWCDKSYSKKHDLGRHLKTKHNQATTTPIKTKNRAILKACLTNNQYKCDVCSKSFLKGSNLLRHRTIHENLKLYCCSLCGKSFRLNMSLTRHISEVHQDVRKFECKVCNMMFKNKWSRDEHVNTHSDSRPYICDICGKSFRQSASLYVHKQYHSSDCPFKCNVCHKGFQRKHNLQKHHLIHTGLKSYRCEDCGALFTAKQTLNRHKKCHDSGILCRRPLEGVIIRNEGFCGQN